MRSQHIFSLVTVFVVIIQIQAFGQATWHVDVVNCPGPGTGIEIDPLCSIQRAIELSPSGGEIIVKQGTYHELIDFTGKAITLQNIDELQATTINVDTVVFTLMGKTVAFVDGSDDVISSKVTLLNTTNPTIDSILIDRESRYFWNSGTNGIAPILPTIGFTYSDGTESNTGGGSAVSNIFKPTIIQDLETTIIYNLYPVFDDNSFDLWMNFLVTSTIDHAVTWTVRLGFLHEQLTLIGNKGTNIGTIEGIFTLTRDEEIQYYDSRHASVPVGSQVAVNISVELLNEAVFTTDLFDHDFRAHYKGSINLVAECGDGILNELVGEECDDGGGETATCDVDCTLVECGDGTLNVTSGEQCDDGNLNENDLCSGLCNVQGTCCDRHDGYCRNYILQENCTGTQPNWTAGETCQTVICDPATGACCNTRIGTCTNNLIVNECQGEHLSWMKGEDCSAENCPDPFIPTMNEWGMVIMALLILIAAKLRFGNRRYYDSIL